MLASTLLKRRANPEQQFSAARLSQRAQRIEHKDAKTSPKGFTYCLKALIVPAFSTAPVRLRQRHLLAQFSHL
jgi:hypothetical protein